MIPDQATTKWLRSQAYTVLAELMTSDDDRIALRAAQIVINSLERLEREDKEHRDRADQKEQRIVIRYGGREDTRHVPAASGATGNPGQSRAVPGSGLRTAVGQDRNGQDSRA